MKLLLTCLICLQLPAVCHAQSVLNVRAFEEDGVVEILYDLFTTKVDKEFYVTLKVSKDGGKVYIPIYETLGDANKNVKPGSNHFIIWNPQQAPNDSLIFKVEAEVWRSPEEQVNPNLDKLFSHEAGQIRIAKVARFNRDIEVTFVLKNLRAQNNMFIATKFFVKDEKNQDYSKVIVSQNDRVGSLITCNPSNSTTFKVRIEGVPETIETFNNIGFTLSEMQVSFSTVKIER